MKEKNDEATEVQVDIVDGSQSSTAVRESSRKRRHPRRREERGLPDDKTLRELAWAYLELQHRHWPELARQGFLPPLTKASSATLAEEMKDRYLGRSAISAPRPVRSPVWKALAAGYLRYSSDKSNPRSLVQQLKNELDRAHGNGHFIPWQYVFADAAITGTTADRPGYKMAKASIEDESLNIAVLYLDEIGRASRDTIEALRLGQLIASKKKRLIGVSDGFDSDSEMSKVILSIFAAVQEWFIDQLRSKVNRGMRDAFFRGTNLRPPAIGYKLAPAVDSDGNPLYGGDGERLMMLVICEETAPDVLLAFELYAESKWSLSKIGRHFNDLKVGNQTWDSTHVKQLLTRYKYRGIDTENMTYKETDPETGDITIKERPRNEWWVRRARNLKIVSRELWKKTRQRLAESAEAYASNGKATKSRTEINPTTLVRPICGDCEKPMWLGRSGKNASFTCLNGRDGKRNCKNRGYKMVKIVETAIVNHVREKILTEDRIVELVKRANDYLQEEALKPRVDTTPWKAEIKELTAKRNRLAKVLETEGEEDLGVVVKQIRRYERQLSDLNRKVREAEAVGAVPSPINLEDVLHHLVDLRGLLNQDVAQAEPVLREVTGPVVVHIRVDPGNQRKTWIAEFKVNLVPVVAKLAAAGNCPTARAWELLNTRGWTTGETSTVQLEKTPKYEALAPKFKKLKEHGASIQTIASAHGMSWDYAKEILNFAETGKRPKWKARKRTGRGDRTIFKKISGDVVRLRDEEQMSFQRIRTWLLEEQGIEVSRNTVRRAYDFGHPEEIEAAAETGNTPHRGRYSHLGPEKYDHIRELIRADRKTKEIAAIVGCGQSTVRRERKRLAGVREKSHPLGAHAIRSF